MGGVLENGDAAGQAGLLTLIIFSFQNLWNTGTNVLIQSEQLKTLNYALAQIVSGGIARYRNGCRRHGDHDGRSIIIFLLSQSNVMETVATSGMKD